ncbi:MAG: DUF3341 domain-containing protein [Acidobacteria bacterium]|nr:MAG: DUF3341 domain-containing protein [Acidobacteriota bacterium]
MADTRTLQLPFCGVAGSFANEHPWRRALAQARDQGLEFEAYSPFADEETVRELRPGATTSVVRLWTLLGGIFGGVVVAFAMAIWMSRNWPLVVGGKPIVSWPPFICICFEMTVLYAAFACTGACFVKGQFPHLTLPAAYRPEFMHDHYGIFLACAREEAGELRSRLERSGAQKSWLVFNPERGRLALPVEWGGAEK